MVPNFLSPLEFRVAIKRLPNTSFSTQQTSVPGVSSSAVLVPTRFNKTFRPGDEAEFPPLELTFMVDENMQNYREIFDWIISTTFPESHEQFGQDLFSDITVVIYNSKKNPHIQIEYKNCFPTNLSEVTLNTADSDLNYPQASATFQYDSYSIQML